MTRGLTARRPKGEAPKGLWLRLYTSVTAPTDKTRGLSDRAYRRWTYFLASYKAAGCVPVQLKTLALAFGCNQSAAKTSMDEIVIAGLAHLTPNGYDPHDWDQMQYESDSSTERVRAFRERRKKQVGNVSGNNFETCSEYIVQSTEKETPPTPSCEFDLSEIARAIWARHPKGRKGSLQDAEHAIAQRLMGAVHPQAVANDIDRRHAGWCRSRQWRDGYAMGLSKWLISDGPGTCMSDPPDDEPIADKPSDPIAARNERMRKAGLL